MGALKANNKALREKLNKVDEDKGTTVAAKSEAVMEAYKISLPCRKERLDGIKRAWEGLASTLFREGKITADDLLEMYPIPCLGAEPTYKEERLDFTDDLIQQMFDFLHKASKDLPS